MESSDLISAVHHLAETSLANPDDRLAHRDFRLWANAVRTAILEHGEENIFEDRINGFDQSFAQRMGISLD